ncbi:MAG: hypothetical protein ACT4OZ_01950 [Gemmatimonadota bacterium]
MVWLLHFITTYAIVAIGCGRTGSWRAAGPVLILTGVAATVLVWLALRGRRSANGAGGHRRGRGSRGSGQSDDGAEDALFGRQTSALATAIGGVAITFTVVALLFLNDCR